MKKGFISFVVLLSFLLILSFPAFGQTTSNSWGWGWRTPALSTVAPNSAAAGGAGFSMAVTGKNFCYKCVVLWNGSRRPTKIVSSTQAVVSIYSTDIAQAGTDSVQMLSPLNGTKSNALPFTVSATGTTPPPVSVAVAPTSTSLQCGKNQQFSASVSGTTDTVVTWAASGGSISSGGTYTAPLSPGSYVVTATSAADTTKSASAAVAVNAPVAVTISPASAPLPTGGSQQFTATVSGSTNTGVTWSATGGTISSSGMYTAPSTAGTYTVTATSAADPTKSASASISVSSAVSVTISPVSASVSTGGSQQFAATVSGTANTGVTWSATGGTISSAGLYTAPSTAGSFTVKATSVADSTKSASATVTVSAPVVAVTLSPTSASMLTSGTQQFTATVTGSSNASVTWSATGGSISSSGLYTAPSSAGTYTVTATSAADSTKWASATVTVSAPVVSVSVSPGSASLSAGGTQQFTASVSGSSNTAVNWSATGGTVSASGLYTAPGSAGTYTVKATSVADNTKSASATVTVSAPVVAVTLSPTSASILTSGTQQFTATVTGTTNTAVTWSATGGPISSSGLYTAPATAGTYTVTATSVVDTTKSASATVAVQASTAYAFDDEFNGTAIDTTQWYLFDRHDNWGGSDCFHPANITEGGGLATITARKESIPCTGGGTYNYTSGMMSWSTFGYTYGSIEYRAKFPTNQGEWPAFWLLGTLCQPTGGGGSCNWPNPGSDEIDITEVMASDQPDPAHPTVINQQLHTGSHNDGCKATTSDISQNFHVYRLEWSPGLAVWKIDGVTTCTINQSYVPSTPMFLLVDIYMGSYGGSIVDSALPQTLQVDYVRVSSSNTPPPPVVAVSVSPTSASLATGATQQFTATVTGSTNTAVTWSATGGTVSASGLYTAPGSAGTYTVKATSVADNTKSASATVTVSAPIQHTVTLTWTASTSTVAGYNVYRGTVSGGPYTMINSALDATTNYADFTVQSGQTYYYVVTAVDSVAIESGFSAETVAVIPFP